MLKQERFHKPTWNLLEDPELSSTNPDLKDGSDIFIWWLIIFMCGLAHKLMLHELSQHVYGTRDARNRISCKFNIQSGIGGK